MIHGLAKHFALAMLLMGSTVGAAADSMDRADVIAPPVPIYTPMPQYPGSASNRPEGMVLMLMDIDVDGHVITARVDQSSGYRVLDDAALSAIWHWRFKPKTVNGVAVEGYVRLPVNFNAAPTPSASSFPPNATVMEGEKAASVGDFAEAFRKFEPLAIQGNALAQYDLARVYYFGSGVPVDYVKALTWFQKAAEQGHPRAQAMLAGMYMKGQGVPRDYATAAVWFRKAAEQHYVDAEFILGDLYEGGIGVPRDYVEAARWYRVATAHGSPVAAKSLAIMYAEGRGVPKSPEIAYALFHLPSNVPDRPDQARARGELSTSLTHEQIAASNALVQQMKQVGVLQVLDSY